MLGTTNDEFVYIVEIMHINVSIIAREQPK